jgi:CRP/FNR family transcriptional regulator, cyclic AMP receptor protein
LLSPPFESSARRQIDGIALLRNHKMCFGIEPSQVEALVSMAHLRRIASGTTLFSKGDPGTELFVVASGTVKITVPSSDGREAIITLLHKGAIFGEIALLDGQPRTADAVAMTDCDLMAITRRDFLRFVSAEPNVATKLIALVCERLRAADARIEEAALVSLPTRLARLLVQLLEDNATDDNKKLAITQQKISEMLGASRESVNKHLRAWAKHKVIAIKRGLIVVLAPQELASHLDDGEGKAFNRPCVKLGYPATMSAAARIAK